MTTGTLNSAISEPTITVERNVRFRAFDKKALKDLCLKLEEAMEEAHQKEVQNTPNYSDFNEIQKSNLKSGFQLRVQITGEGGYRLNGKVSEVFESNNFPEKVMSLYIKTDLNLRTFYNYIPRNYLEIFIDFSKPKIFDFSFAPAVATLNESSYTISGLDKIWVEGVGTMIEKEVSKSKLHFSFWHKQSVYDFVLWLFSFPFAFWLLANLSKKIEGISSSVFINSAVYFYVFIFVMMVTRVLFHWARWLWPVIKYEQDKSGSFGKSLFVLFVTPIVASFGYDVLKYLYKVFFNGSAGGT